MLLVVEADTDLCDLLCFAVRRAGYEVLAVPDATAVLPLLNRMAPQLILLDLAQPTRRAWAVCRQLCRATTAPLVLLADSRADDDIVRGLELGAADYLVKPLSAAQLVARITAVLRRRATTVAARVGAQGLTMGDLRLDPQWRTVSRGAASVRLTATEFKLLFELVLHEGQVLTHQQLTDRIWGEAAVTASTLVKGHIRNLRRKLEPGTGAPVYLHTVGGVGYSFRCGPGSGTAAGGAGTRQTVPAGTGTAGGR